MIKYAKKIICLLCILLCFCVVGCGKDNENNEKTSEKNRINSIKECFENIEQIVETKNYSLNITEYEADSEYNIGFFDVSSSGDDTYIGYTMSSEDEENPESTAYSYLYHYNCIDYVSELFEGNNIRTVHYAYAGNLWDYEDENGEMQLYFGDYLTSVSEKNIDMLVKSSFEDGTTITVLPDYQLLKTCILKMVTEKDLPFVKMKEKSEDKYKVAVGFKDFLKWCDSELSDYNISTEMSYVIDTYEDDTVLEICFEIEDDNVKNFSMIQTSENTGKKLGFRWEISTLDMNPETEYNVLIEQMKPDNYGVAAELLVNDLDQYYTNCFPEYKVLYGIETDNTYTGVIKVLIIGEDAFGSQVYVYNGYDYSAGTAPEEIEWHYNQFYNHDVWLKAKAGETLNEDEKLSEWKAEMLDMLIYYSEYYNNGNIIYLNDDDIPEVVISDGENIYIMGYINGQITGYDVFECKDESDSEDILYVQSRNMKICTYEYSKLFFGDYELYNYKEITLDESGSYEIVLYLSRDIQKFSSGENLEYYYLTGDEYENDMGTNQKYITKDEYDAYVTNIESNYEKVIVNSMTMYEIIYNLIMQ